MLKSHLLGAFHIVVLQTQSTSLSQSSSWIRKACKLVSYLGYCSFANYN